jgi:hypothetical protein
VSVGPPRVAFLEVDCSRTLYASWSRPYLGFERRLARDSFPSPLETLTTWPSPGLCGPGSFVRASSPLRSSFASPPGRPSSERPLLPGFRPSSRRHRRHLRPFGPLAGCGSSQPPASCRPQVFSTSRRFAPSSVARACFIPQPRPGFASCRPGVSPVPQWFPARRWTLPPCRSPKRAGRRPGRHSLDVDFEALFRGDDAFLRFGG